MSSQLFEIIKIISQIYFGYVIVPYITNKACNHYQIKKVYDHKKIIKVSIPPQFKRRYNDIVLNKINNQKFKEAALEFSKVLIENFPEETLTNFYNNLNELTIKKNKLISLTGAVGCYSSLSNSITILDSSSIYHELFHMASRSYNKKDGSLYVGFRQRNIKLSKIFYNEIGRGLNEGYTELLAHRYFDNKAYSSYDFETDIARKLEMIIGQDKMTELYLRGDLAGLIAELKIYMPENDIIKFITRLDLITGYDSKLRKIIVRESIFDLYEFLLKTYALKLKKQYEDELINLNGFETLSNEYLESFKNRVYLASKGFELKNIYEMYKNILKDINAPEHIIKHSGR